MKESDWISIYAATVGTAALLLNFRSWYEARPRLHLSLMVDGMTIGGDSELDEKDLLILTVTNRGRETTMITHMILFEMTSFYQQLCVRPKKSYIIPNPQLKGYPHNIPSDLDPAKKWVGVVRKRDDLGIDLHDGHHYVGVYASHRDKPYLIKIPKKKTTLPDNTEALASS